MKIDVSAALQNKLEQQATKYFTTPEEVARMVLEDKLLRHYNELSTTPSNDQMAQINEKIGDLQELHRNSGHRLSELIVLTETIAD